MYTKFKTTTNILNNKNLFQKIFRWCEERELKKKKRRENGEKSNQHSLWCGIRFFFTKKNLETNLNMNKRLIINSKEKKAVNFPVRPQWCGQPIRVLGARMRVASLTQAFPVSLRWLARALKLVWKLWGRARAVTNLPEVSLSLFNSTIYSLFIFIYEEKRHHGDAWRLFRSACVFICWN